MAEKFCNKFGGGPHQLKIGNSFQKKGNNSVFHSIRYDFTPLSVDEDRMGKLEVQENNSVSVTLPHNDGINATNYKGGAKAHGSKDCILIIDHETGELTLERLSNQILLKKTRAEKPEKHPSGQTGDGASGVSNPYLVKQEPANPYAVKREPEKPSNPYAVKREPDKPRLSNGRPSTPQSASKHKKHSPATDTGVQHSASTASISPIHSNKNSPVRLPQHSRGLSESSDSNSSSSSDSDSDSDSNASTNEKSCQLLAAMEESPAPAASNPGPLSMPGDFNDLFLPGGGGGGQLPTARPQKHKKPEKMKQKVPTPVRTESESKSSLGGSSMPNLFTDLGDDLQLTDESDD